VRLSATPLALALLGAGVLAVAAAGASDDLDPERPDPPPFPPHPDRGEVQELIRAMCAAIGLDAGWVMFVEAAALGESGMNPRAARGVQSGAPEWVDVNHDPNEANAAEIAFDRNRKRYFADCPWRADEYTFGSGGLWGSLPANALPAFKGTPEICRSPWSVFEPAPALVMHLEYCRRVMRYDAFKANPSWGNLRAGMGAVTRLNNPEVLEAMRTGQNKFGDRLEQLGYDRAQVDGLVTPLPAADPVGWLQTLENL